MNPFLLKLAEWLLLLTAKNVERQNPCLAKRPARRSYLVYGPPVRGRDAKNILGKPVSLLGRNVVREGISKEVPLELVPWPGWSVLILCF